VAGRRMMAGYMTNDWLDDNNLHRNLFDTMGADNHHGRPVGHSHHDRPVGHNHHGRLVGHLANSWPADNTSCLSIVDSTAYSVADSMWACSCQHS